MSNTDGEDIQRIEDLDRKMWAIVQATPTFSSNPEDYLKPWRELINQKLASLREQLATEQDMRSTAEFANRMIIKDLNEKLKQKEDENRELVKGIMEIFNGCKTSEAGYANDDGEFAKGKTQAYRYTAKKIKDMLTWLGHNLSA